MVEPRGENFHLQMDMDEIKQLPSHARRTERGKWVLDDLKAARHWGKTSGRYFADASPRKAGMQDLQPTRVGATSLGSGLTVEVVGACTPCNL
jgi:hypothetical protein